MEDFPSARIGTAPAVKVDISPELDMEELEANDNVSKPDKEPDIEDEAEANVPAMKSTCRGEASKHDAGKNTATKPPPTPQHGTETMGNSRYPDKTHKPLGDWWKNPITPPWDKHDNYWRT